MTVKLSSNVMQTLFWHYLSVHFSDVLKTFVPSDFIDLCCKGISVLHQNGKDNILYYLAKGLGTPRADKTGPRLPLNKMPFGLVSYNIRYFALDSVNNVKADPDYIQWESTMFSNFGHKWLCLQRGPGFAYGVLENNPLDSASHEAEVQGTETVNDDASHGILQQAWEEAGVDVDSPDNASEPFDASSQELHVQNEHVPLDPSTNNASTCSSSQELTFLWAWLSGQDKEEIVTGDNPIESEEMHGVRPQPSPCKKKEVDPMKAKVNVAGHSVRTIQCHIQATAFTRDTNIQVCSNLLYREILNNLFYVHEAYLINPLGAGAGSNGKA